MARHHRNLDDWEAEHGRGVRSVPLTHNVPGSPRVASAAVTNKVASIVTASVANTRFLVLGRFVAYTPRSSDPVPGLAWGEMAPGFD